MDLLLERNHGTTGFTIGKLSHDGALICYILEDEERLVKIQGQTAIPCGRYRVTITHSNRFNRLMPLLLDVPGFSGIRIHNGRIITTASDTEGCLLPGDSPDYEKGTLRRVELAYLNIYSLIENGLSKGEVWINII